MTMFFAICLIVVPNVWAMLKLIRKGRVVTMYRADLVGLYIVFIGVSLLAAVLLYYAGTSS